MRVLIVEDEDLPEVGEDFPVGHVLMVMADFSEPAEIVCEHEDHCNYCEEERRERIEAVDPEVRARALGA